MLTNEALSGKVFTAGLLGKLEKKEGLWFNLQERRSFGVVGDCVSEEAEKIDAVMVWMSAPEEEAAELARKLVSSGVAACVQEFRGVRAHFIWQNELQQSAETVLCAKTTADRVAELRSRVVEWHSYEVPEILVTQVDDGLPSYLQWVNDSRGGVCNS